MGLFSSKPALTLPPTTNISVSDDLVSQLPDPGEILIDIYRQFAMTHAGYQSVSSELNRVRFPTGGYDLRNVRYDKKVGPLGLLWWITAGDWMVLQVWASSDVSRGQKKDVESIVVDLCRNQGIPAAASWALAVWSASGREAPHLDTLAALLDQKYGEQLATITNDMVRDSIKKWKR